MEVVLNLSSEHDVNILVQTYPMRWPDGFVLPLGGGRVSVVSRVSLFAVLRVWPLWFWCCKLWTCRVMEVLHVV